MIRMNFRKLFRWNDHMRKEKGAQPLSSGILCGFKKKGFKHRIEKPSKRTYHYQDFKPDNE